MAAALLSPVHSSRALPSDKMSHSEEMERLAPGMLSSRSSSYRSANSNLNNNSPRGTSPPGSGGSMATLAAEGTLTDRQRSGSRISLRPSYETLSMASNGGEPTASSNPDSVAAQAVPVAAIGKVNVTDPWGTAWGMDSPYDASNAYSTNPNRITMRQSAYFGSGLTLAALAGPGPGPISSYLNGSHMASTSSGQLHPHSAAGSPAPSSFSSISGSQISSGNTNVWSEVSSTRSFNGVIPPSAPWITDANSKRRSVSFQGDLSQFGLNGIGGAGIPSPTYSSDSHQSSAMGAPHHYPSHHHYSPHHHPQMPNLRARSTTHLPSLLKQHRHSTTAAALPMNRRTTSTPGTDQDRNAFRKSFIGGSVVSHSNQSASLPPVPVDPKVLAKQSKKSSSANMNGKNSGTNGGNASSRASIMTIATDRTDALSTTSGVEGGAKKNKRKSWFARSPSSLGVVDTLPTSTSSHSNTSIVHGKHNNTRRSTESLSATSHASSSSSRPPALSRAGSSFNTFSGSPPPPTPPIPDTLPLPPSSLNDKSRKSSSNSLKNRVNTSSSFNPGVSSAASTPSPSIVEMPPPAPSVPASAMSSSANNGQNLAVASGVPPATPHGTRVSKTQTTPSIYGTPLASPTSNIGGYQAGSTNVNTYGAPTSSSPLSMSPMTSPTSAASIPLKPAASARPSALQLSTHEEHSMQPDSFPSPGTHSESLSRDEGSYNPLLPAVTTSLPPTPLTESGPGGPARNALAPAAVIKASPSSPPALGSLAALADEERASLHMHSPTQTPTSTNAVGAGRARISPAGVAAQAQRARSSSRPTSPLDPQQRGASLQAMETANSAPLSSRTRSSSKGSLGQRSPPSISPAASRKASNNSLRATVRHAPPSPEPSSAIVEHMPPGSPELDDQFLPVGRFDASAQPSSLAQIPMHPIPVAAPVLVLEKDTSAAPPHQPGLDMSLSSFAPRKAFPVNTGSHNNSGPVTIAPLPRKSSAQSVLPETVPLPESPALLQDGFASPQAVESQMPLQPRGLAPQSHNVIDKASSAKQLKPRASSPNLQNASQEKASTGKSQANTQSFPSKTSKGPDTPARKPSKSPFGLFKRTRSKTLGDGSPSPSEAVAAQLYAPPSPMPMQRKPSTQYESVVPTGSPPKPTSAQMTPAQTPQLSFSSSTTSTIAGSEPSDQFYADFAPDSRPSFSNHPSSSSNGNNTISASGNRDTTLKKSAPASSKNFQAQQNSKMPLNGNSKPLNGAPPSKGAFSRMFGGPAKRKV